MEDFMKFTELVKIANSKGITIQQDLSIFHRKDGRT